jgi:Galactosyltransferase
MIWKLFLQGTLCTCRLICQIFIQASPTRLLQHAHFILKTDDDSFNVPQRMVDYLLSHVPLGEPFVGGLCASGEEPNRVNWHKWYVPDSSYPGSVFPLHCKVITTYNCCSANIAAMLSLKC